MDLYYSIVYQSSNNVKVLTQIAYPRRRFIFYVKFYACFFEKLDEGIIIVFAEADIALYPGIGQYFGTQDTWCVGGIYGAPLEADAMQCRLNDDVLFGVDGATDFVPFAGWYSKLIPQTTQLQAVLKAGGSAVITGRQNMLTPDRYRPNIVTATG